MHAYSEDTEYLTIRNDPISIPDPFDYVPPARPISPKPYLRKGAGLQRYQMSVEYFKKGPPDLYRRPEFKSFLSTGQQKKEPAKVQKELNSFRPCLKTKSLPKTFEPPLKPQPVRSFPERKYALNTMKCFDDEIIPSLRARSNEAFEVVIDTVEKLCGNHVTPSKTPKTPIKKLVLKPGGLPENYEESHEGEQDTVAEEDSDSNSVHYEAKPESARRLSYEFPSGKNTYSREINMRHDEIGQKCGNPKYEQYNVLQNDEESTDDGGHKDGRWGAQQVALAMKRKGLTDNVKKHLAWNVTPRKKRFTKIIKVRKATVKKEKYTIHEYKNRLTLLLEENKKLLADNHKMKIKEKEVQDEKVRLLKIKRENEDSIKVARGVLDEDRLKLLEDQKKLKREKAAFDQYCQDTRNLPSREDRELIRNLKEEILRLKEEQKTKDARVGAAQAQLRNRVVFLENENKELKKDLESAQRVTSKKAVRFESMGNIRNKVIDAINNHLDENITKPRPRSAGDKSTTTFKPTLRRSKSAMEIKTSVKPAVNRKRGMSANSNTERKKDTEKEVIISVADKGDSDDEENPVPPEVIDLVGQPAAAKIYTKDGDDSGVGSKYSSENSPSRSCPILSGSAESDLFRPYQKENIRYFDNGIEKCCSANDIIDRGRKIDCKGCMPTAQENQHSPTSRHPLQWANYTPSLNITSESSISTPCSLPSAKTTASNGSASRMCGRHASPLVADASKLWSSCLLDRDVVRTQLASGDVEEEELHTGVRRVLCGACGAVEISYRNRPGYRRTHLPQEEILEEHPNGVVELRRKNGEVLRKYPNGDRLLIMANGDKELTTRGYKKLETVNGTVKILFDSGRTETRYRSGRVRIKDEKGHLIMDTGGLPCS